MCKMSGWLSREIALRIAAAHFLVDEKTKVVILSSDYQDSVYWLPSLDSLAHEVVDLRTFMDADGRIIRMGYSGGENTVVVAVGRGGEINATAPEKCERHDFSGLSDLDLVQLQKEMRRSDDPSDKVFLNAVLVELGRRQELIDGHGSRNPWT